MLEMKANSVIKLRNGKCGVVMGFNNQPSLLVFDSFVCQMARYNGTKHKTKDDYDIVEVYEGKKVEKYSDVYRKKFDFSKLKCVYKEGENE